jgi:hypothetical protein
MYILMEGKNFITEKQAILLAAKASCHYIVTDHLVGHVAVLYFLLLG